jgi:hypothetical protein
MNPLIEYYKDQAGSGLVGFHGVKYQRGHGFFGRILSKAVFPLLRFLGAKALSTGAQVANDVLTDDKDWKESMKTRFTAAGKDVAQAGIKKATEYLQKGSGRKRKRLTKTKVIKRRKVSNIKKKPSKKKKFTLF